MAHDWGVKVPDLDLDGLIELQDGLRDGTITFELPEAVRKHEKASHWLTEMRDQTIAAYDREISRKIS